MLLVDLLLGFGIGTLIGMLGGGGSILTVPTLVYLVGRMPQAAVTTSLAIVGANSVMETYFQRSRGALNGRVALVFGGVGGRFLIVPALPLDIISLFVIGGLAGTFAGFRLGQIIDAHLLRRTFAVCIIGLALVLLVDHLPKALG